MQPDFNKSDTSDNIWLGYQHSGSLHYYYSFPFPSPSLTLSLTRQWNVGTTEPESWGSCVSCGANLWMTVVPLYNQAILSIKSTSVRLSLWMKVVAEANGLLCHIAYSESFCICNPKIKTPSAFPFLAVHEKNISKAPSVHIPQTFGSSLTHWCDWDCTGWESPPILAVTLD